MIEVSWLAGRAYLDLQKTLPRYINFGPDASEILDSVYLLDQPIANAAFQEADAIAVWDKYVAEGTYEDYPVAHWLKQAALELITGTRAGRDYLRNLSRFYKARDQLDLTAKMHPTEQGTSRIAVTLVALYLVLVSLVVGSAGDISQLLAPTLMTVIGLLGVAGNRYLKRKRRESAFDDALSLAEEDLEFAETELIEYLDRNPWFTDAAVTFLNKICEKAAQSDDDTVENQDLEHLSEVLIYKEAEDPYADEALFSPAENGHRGMAAEVPDRMDRFSPRAYEAYCGEWMRFLGSIEVQLTARGPDGGLDVISLNEVAQVKLHGRPVTIQPIRELFGLASSANKIGYFFTSTGYTSTAIDFAETHGVYLFVADPVGNSLTGVTGKALRLYASRSGEGQA